MKKTKGLKITLCALCLLLVCGLFSPCLAADDEEAGGEEVVRVAYFNVEGYYTTLADGSVDSYDADYLKKVAAYSGLRFEYVDCGTWQNALVMLQNGEVDLVGTMQWTPEREKLYEFCLESYGYTVGELAALPGRGYVYEDYEAIGNSVIGCTENYVRLDEIKALFAEKGIQPQIKTYPEQAELNAALESGEIDIMAANSHLVRADWTVLEKFTYAPFFFVSRKGNTALTDKIDNAMIQINLYDPTFDDTLVEQRFPILIGSPFTKAEYDCIARGETYTVYFDGTTKPLVWLDEESGQMKGILADVCAQLEEKTGLQLEIRRRTEDTPTAANIVTYETLYYSTEDALDTNDGITDALLDESFNLYHRSGEAYRTGGAYTIAVVKNRAGLLAYLGDKYPSCTLVEYDTPLACAKAVKNGQADLAFLNTHVADNILTTESMTSVTTVPVAAETFGIALHFHGEDRALLASIVNKGMKLVDNTALSELMLQYALDTAPKATLGNFVKAHLSLTMSILAWVVILLVTMTAMYTYARVMRRERDRVEQADRDKTDFFARMSHDMRTPMNGILGMIELTQDAKDMAEVQGNMAKAKAAGDYMLSLINDTLDLQRLESGRMKIEPQVVQAGEYLHGITSMLQASATQKGLDFRVENINADLTTYLKIDPVRVKQIFVNLVSNAIKFTPESGAVVVTMEELAREGNVVHDKFTVRDTGIGMTAEFMKNGLYHAYSQERNEVTGRYAGSGLGLAITKNLIDMMHGRIEVESEAGEGTTFTVWLDFETVDAATVDEAHARRESTDKKARTELAGKCILVCEDHPLNAEIARRLLEKVGCTVAHAENGQVGVEMFSASTPNHFDAILMDIRMPVMDGLTAAKAIRALPRPDAATVPILAMTANAYDTDVQQSKDAGMNAHLAKPIEPQLLYATLAQFVR